VSRGSCARATVATNDNNIAVASAMMRQERSSERAELVVRVSLAPERTVYFTL
jgi:hypothetical protein